MPRVRRHLATLRPRSAAVSTGAAFSDDEGFSDDIRLDELTNGLIRVSVGSGHADLETAELVRLFERINVAPALVEMAYERGKIEGREELRLELEETKTPSTVVERQLVAVDAEYEPPKEPTR